MNKSDFELDGNHTATLKYRLNFAPIPNWSKKTEDNEHLNFVAHIRRAEWDNLLTDNINFHDSADKLPEKPKIPKFNRPDRDLLHEKVVNYTDRIAAKLRSIEKHVKADHRQKNNLKISERKVIEELRRAVKNKQIVI